MPLAAVVDGYIFCTHGGIPEQRKYEQLGFKRAVNSIPVPLCDPELQLGYTKVYRLRNTVQFIFNFTCHVNNRSKSPLAWDLMWADPARESDLNEQNQDLLFLENERRKTSCLFTEKALKEFMNNTGYHYVIRAHECHVSVF